MEAPERAPFVLTWGALRELFLLYMYLRSIFRKLRLYTAGNQLTVCAWWDGDCSSGEVCESGEWCENGERHDGGGRSEGGVMCVGGER